jgi:hypothetical protein
MDTMYVEQLVSLRIKPWEMRNKYIQVLLGNISLAELAGDLRGEKVDSEQLVRLQLLLEAQRYRQQMYMSCGWFFEDFGRIEPRNNVAYAAQAVNLMRMATGKDLTAQLIADLCYVSSQSTGLRGDTVFRNYLQRATTEQLIETPSPVGA